MLIGQCSTNEAVRFACCNDCDEEHVYSDEQYCLTYLPDSGICFMKSYDRDSILACHEDNTSNTNPNHWLVFTGGSNIFSALKVLSDLLIEVPFNSSYDLVLLRGEFKCDGHG